MDLTQAALFDSLLSFRMDGIEVDLHNEYDCRVLSFNKDPLKLSFVNTFTSQTVILLFEDALICLLSLDLGIQNRTLDLFYRGRFEEQEDVLFEYDQQGRSYFYLNFDNESEIQLLARTVKASLA